MSYCRWSDNDFQCDVYVYEDVKGGYTTHVASNRPVYTEPLPPRISLDEHKTCGDFVDRFLERNEKMKVLLNKAERKAIGLPHDGETFNDPTPEATADRLQSLKDMGYNVPDYAIESLREEAKQKDLP